MHTVLYSRLVVRIKKNSMDIFHFSPDPLPNLPARPGGLHFSFPFLTPFIYQSPIGLGSMEGADATTDVGGVQYPNYADDEGALQTEKKSCPLLGWPCMVGPSGDGADLRAGERRLQNVVSNASYTGIGIFLR